MFDHQSHQAKLLRRYEITGLRLLAWLHLIVVVLGIIGTLTTAQGALRTLNLFFAVIPLWVFLVVMLRVERVENLERMGLLIASFDAFALAWLPVSWYLFQGNASAPELLLENDLVIFYILMATVHSITLRPSQPLLAGAVGVIVMTGCYFWAVSVGLPPPATDWLVAINTRQVDMGSFWFKALFMLPFACGTLALLAWRGRQLVSRTALLERSMTTLSQYFSPKIVGELINNDSLNLSLTGQQRDIAVLFVDLVGFTELSEKLRPAESVALLADYFQRMVACVFANNGSVDKFLGDGLMATFNILGDQPQAAQQAVLAGIAMQHALQELNAERQQRGLAPLGQRISVHFGAAVVGNVGTAQRMEFTAIGDTVNTASRLQEICKQLQADFIISASVYQRFPEAPAKDMGTVSLRGKSELVQVYAVDA